MIPSLLLRRAGLLVAAASVGTVRLPAMTLLVGNTDLETGNFVAVAGADGRLVRSGSGFVAVGAFEGLDDAAIRAAAGSVEGLQGLLGGFRQLGEARSFGLGEGLERIDGAFQLPVSAPTRADDGLVGRPVFVIGGTESGLFIFKSRIAFEADQPVASGTVEMWGDDPAELAGSLLVGGVGESISVLELGSSGHSIRLAPVGGTGLDVSRFEATFPPPPGALVISEPVPPAVPAPPVDEPPAAPPIPEMPAPIDPLPPPAGLPGEGETGGSMVGAVTPPGSNLIPPGIDPWLGGGGVWVRLETTGLSHWSEDGLLNSAWIMPTGYGGHDHLTSRFQTAAGGAAFGIPFAAVPEPGSVTLLAFGGLLLCRRSRSNAGHRAT